MMTCPPPARIEYECEWIGAPGEVRALGAGRSVLVHSWCECTDVRMYE